MFLHEYKGGSVMSMNVYQNKELANQNNFGAGGIISPENNAQADMLRSMSLPTTPDEFVKFTPYALGAYGFSKLVSDWATKINTAKNSNLTLAESFAKSPLAQLSKKIDGKLVPILNRYSSQIQGTKSAIQKHTPGWIKNIAEKIKIGVSPKFPMAIYNYRGLTAGSANYFLDLFKDVPLETINKLGIQDLINAARSNKMTAVNAVQEIGKRLANVPIKDLQVTLPQSKGLFGLFGAKKINLAHELNKSRGFIAANAKTTVTKGIQKGAMSVAEAAGGGVIGGTFGIIMNSIFLASTLKRTWDAPWGEKLSTFMEGALVDFCGGYLMMLLGSRITYKLLGIKNVDKSAAQLKNIGKLTAKIATDKQNYQLVQQALKNGMLTPELVQKLGIDVTKFTSKVDLLKAIKTKVPNATTINASIDKLAKMKAFQSNGFWKNLIYKPLSWIGNFFSVGLDSLPSKLADGKNVSAFKALLSKAGNFLKGAAGFPIRFILITAIITPPLQKLCAKISHTLFGKPTNSIYQEDNKKKDENKSAASQIKMENFADFTKLSGMVKQQANGNKPTFALPAGQISPTLINQAVINQQQRINQAQPISTIPQQIMPQVMASATSPATYIPDATPTHFSNAEEIAAINRQFDKAEKIGKQIDKRLAKYKSGEAFEF